MTVRIGRDSLTILAVALCCVASMPAAHAQEASAWAAVPHGAARLIAGAAHESTGGVWLRAGVEIRLAPGWHTYWRYPGASGVPPTFDFTASENLKSAAVLWPAPVVFADGVGGRSIGYVDDVVFPLRIDALDAKKPVSLHLKFAYAICRELCLPAEADLTLGLSRPGSAGAHETALAAAEGRVPRRVALSEAATMFGIRAVYRERGPERKRVVVDVAAPEGMSIDLLVEGPTPDWALPLPKLIFTGSGNRSAVRRYAFELDGLPSGAQPDGAILTFTLVSPVDAVEVVTRVDH